MRDGSWFSRSILSADGTIYLCGGRKSTDDGKTFVDCDRSDPFLDPILSQCQHRGRTHESGRSGLGNNENVHRSILQSGQRFVALDYPLYPLEIPQPGKFITTYWHSERGLSRVVTDTAVFHIPEAGYLESDYWGMYGLYCHRGLIELNDGTLLAGLFGNFERDRVEPPQGADIGIKARAFVMKSTDGGRNWHYVGTVATPTLDMTENEEGYSEWDMVQLSDGRLLGVIRTGHYSPLVCSYSSDLGRTWTKPEKLRGLDWGVDPCLIRLKDKRLVLAYGRNERPGSRSCELAISTDGAGANWTNIRVAPPDRRSAYPTIFEVQPNLVFYQAGDECWQIEV